MKELTRKHAPKLLILCVLGGLFVIVGSYFIWNNHTVSLRQPSTAAAPAAIIDITSPTVASPTTMMIKQGSAVEWKNSTSKPVTVRISTNAGEHATVQPGSSYRLSFNQPGTVAYNFGKDNQSQGSLIVQP
jgi:plastocyanin